MALTNSSEGKRILATRYFLFLLKIFFQRFLRPIQPPSQILEKLSQNRESAVGMALQFISAIPFIEDPIMFPGESDLWTTVDEVISSVLNYQGK